MAHLDSLSIWSPKPGVSTIVRDMRVPSSSNSSSIKVLGIHWAAPRCALVHSPTVIGLILTPSSRCAFEASSASFPCKTRFPHNVLTNVVRPYSSALAYWSWSLRPAEYAYRFLMHRTPWGRIGYLSSRSSCDASWSTDNEWLSELLVMEKRRSRSYALSLLA